MGFNTQIQIGNDQWYVIKNNPQSLVDAIDKGMQPHFRTGQASSDMGGYIQVMDSRHADEFIVIIAHRGSFTKMGPYDIEDRRKAGYFEGSGAFRLDIEEREIKAAITDLKVSLKKIQGLKKATKGTNGIHD